VSDLVAFLTARLDEDERVARAATADNADGKWATGERWSVLNLEYEGIHVFASDDPKPPNPDETDPTTVHMARHDPARVLADVAAKRAIMGLAVPGDIDQPEVYAALRYLAAVHADHPDYDPEWSTA
jgi:hypothetical protein